MEMGPQKMRQFLAREREVKGLSGAQSIFNSFSITEKTIFLIFAGLFIVAALSLAYKVNERYLVEVPSSGGELVEGILGTPRFINPLLAISDADRDLTSLVYSGLLKATPSGDFIPDLALRYSISDDGLEYDFVLKDDVTFSDGEPVTADDIVYTITKAQDATLKSPRRVNWEGVTVEKVSDNELIFKLKQSYAPFVSNLTIGILPKHIWKNIEGDQFTFNIANINAVGSGPYKIESVDKNGDGIPTKIVLESNPDYILGKPYIEKFIFKFYGSQNDLIGSLKNGSIEGGGNIGPEVADSIPNSKIILKTPLTRVFGIFFNQNEKEILAHKEVRKALDLVINRQDVIENVLHGYGTPLNGPLPSKGTASTTDSASSTIALAQKILEKGGWKKNPETGIYELKTKSSTSILSFSLSTANIPELVNSARIVEETWKSLGAEVDVRIFEPSDLNQSVIRPRKYDSLLFGLVIGRTPDLYPFWHSSQRNDPGLNIAMYTNAKVDKLLETMRTATDETKIAESYESFEKEIANDTPAIFIWSPDFIYALPKRLHGVELGEITTPSDRFLSVSDWYINTDRIWRVFASDRIKTK
jgi:peptide/nickel transport system substrate-binding protein